MKVLLSALVAGVLAAGAASATTLAVDFQVTTDTAGGAPGAPGNPNKPAARAATAAGSITFDTANAVGSVLNGVPTFSDSSIFTLFSLVPGGIGGNGEFISVPGTATPSARPLPARLPLLFAGLDAFALVRRKG